MFDLYFDWILDIQTEAVIHRSNISLTFLHPISKQNSLLHFQLHIIKTFNLFQNNIVVHFIFYSYVIA